MARSDAESLVGFLVVDKPAGLTSHDVVAQIRKMTGVRRVGHAGTLDPFASGALVVAVGKATRLLRFVSDTRKRYLVQAVLGTETETGDPEGAIIRSVQLDSWPGQQVVDDVLLRFSGTIQQKPPAYSAIRIAGRRAYERARAGETLDMPVRTVVIHHLRRIGYRPPELWLDVECSAGTYIRSLVRDIGRELGPCAYCHGLRRSHVGQFSLARALTLPELESINLASDWQRVALPPAAALLDRPAVILSDNQLISWLHGRRNELGVQGRAAHEVTRVYSCDGSFAGVGRIEPDGRLQPTIVIET